HHRREHHLLARPDRTDQTTDPGMKQRDKTTSEALLRAEDEERYSLDFPCDGSVYEGAYAQRRQNQARGLLDALGVSRDDETGRRLATRCNLEFFGAPQVALLCVPGFAGARSHR
ncbi:hypothetical protein ACIP6Y_40195, partial [Streptomyces sp. NPDC088748]